MHGDFRLDVDNAIGERASFINDIVGPGIIRLTVTAAFEVSVAATSVELAVVGAPRVVIPTTNLG